MNKQEKASFGVDPETHYIIRNYAARHGLSIKDVLKSFAKSLKNEIGGSYDSTPSRTN